MTEENIIEDRIKYSNADLLAPHMDAEQKAYVERAGDAGADFPAVFHMLHNDGDDVRVRFTISKTGNALELDMPLKAFNALPVYEVQPGEREAAKERMDAEDAALPKATGNQAVHPGFVTTPVETGRFDSQAPNMANTPKDASVEDFTPGDQATGKSITDSPVIGDEAEDADADDES